ncbi:hypothetical protein NE865_04450 [Phthorimaea operculella]|nr:hypothetical protein NE865_04450 [Phthorimaea operculella]
MMRTKFSRSVWRACAIVGYNIRPPEGCRHQCSFYVTLHHTTMSAPFYTSERISSPHPKWKEIDSEITQRMSSSNVVIRIWCHILNDSDDDRPQDSIIQTWGVYFSGLRYIGANLALNFTSDCFKSNTLVFQMHGGYFCSYKSLKLDIIPPENEIEHGSLSSDSSGRTNQSKITLESKFIQNQKGSRSVSPNKFSRRNDKEYSKSQSPIDRNNKSFSTIKTSTSLNIQRERLDDGLDKKKLDPNYIYEHSPESNDVVTSDTNSDSQSKNASKEDLRNSKIDLSETAENYDLRNNSDGAPKYRYLALNFLKSEIRQSYNAKKLQQLHILQYEIKKKQEQVQQIKERIYQNSAVTDDGSSVDNFDEKLKMKSKSQRNLFSPEEERDKAQSLSEIKNGRIKEEKPKLNGPRLTLKLNDLLSFKVKPSPFQRAEALRLTKQIEILRFKRLILADERDRKLANLRRLKEIRAKLFEENQDVGLELLEEYHSLSRRSEILKETRQSCSALRELAARSHSALLRQRSSLLEQLHEIFYIEQKNETTWTICDVPLPICGDENPRAPNPLSDAVAAGLAAQATCLAAALSSQPLRYKITLLGSASKILDVTPDLPDPNIPLFARGGDVALFRYAMFLLNKCIAQLVWAKGLPVTDMRPTLANLRKLLLSPHHSSDTAKLFGTHCWTSNCPRTQSLRSLVATDRGKYSNRQFNRFKDCVDGQSPASALTRRHRHSRSVGSYHDDQELPTLDQSTTSIMGSEPNIYNTKLTPENTETPTMKTHNSDSEICKMSEQTRVVFTLGDDVPSETQTLVRISTNNDDECNRCLDDNVKRICSEITDFCTKDSHEGFDVARTESEEHMDIAKHMEGHIDIAKHMESHGHIDIAKHMERKASEIEDIDLCVNCVDCKSNKDGVCDLACAKNVQDVIVIPSAEAILDTGQTLEDIMEQSFESRDGILKEVNSEIVNSETDSHKNVLEEITEHFVLNNDKKVLEEDQRDIEEISIQKDSQSNNNEQV